MARQWKPLRVQLSHAGPKDSRPYRRLLGPHVRFDADVSGIVFEASWLDHVITGADPNLRELVMQAIRQQQANSTMSFADVVRGALHQMVLAARRLPVTWRSCSACTSGRCAND